MRRTIFSIFGFLAIFAMLFTVSCSNEPEIVPEIVPEVDPVETFDKTVLTAIAYPGMNFISWTPVVDAKSYTLFKHEGNVCVEAISFGSTSKLYHVDFDIKNGVEYSYLVEVELNPSSSHVNDYADVRIDPVFPKQMSERAFATAIVPDHTVNAIGLTDFENPAGNADFVVKPENMHIAKHHTYEGDMISYSFPGKAYLKYDVYITRDNEYETINEIEESKLNDESILNPHKNDVIFSGSSQILKSGEYKLVVTAEALNENFAPSDYIISSESVKVDQLLGNGGEIISADYKDIGNTIRLTFNEFKLENGSSVPISNYILYRSEVDSRFFTRVDATIKATNSQNNQFFVDDKISDNKKDYRYTLVVTDGTLYAKEYSSTTVESYSLDEQNETSIDGQQVSTDEIEWNITLPSSDVKINGVYTLEKSLVDTGDVYPGDFSKDDSIQYAKKEDKVFTVTTKHDINKKIYILVVTKQENKADGEWVIGPIVLGVTRIASFCDDGGKELLPSKVTLERDNYELEIPSVPEKTGYVPLHWKDKTGETYESGKTVVLEESTITFTAVYRPLETRIAYFRDQDGNPINTITKVEVVGKGNWSQIDIPVIPPLSGFTPPNYWIDESNFQRRPGDTVSLTKAETFFIATYTSNPSVDSGSSDIDISRGDIIGDIAEDGLPLKENNGAYITDPFVYSNDMDAWGGGNGTCSFKIRKVAGAWDGDYGSTSVGADKLPNGITLGGDGNITLIGLVDGKKYHFELYVEDQKIKVSLLEDDTI